MVREEWLRKAIELLDADLFNGGLDILSQNYQIACGWTKRNKVSEVIFPYDGADVQLDDLFPNTIHVSVTCSDTIEMLTNLAYSCIQCFYGIRKVNSKKFKALAESFYFDAPYSKCNPSDHLKDIIRSVYAKMLNRYGEFPGKAIVIRKKEKEKTGQKNTIKLYCPSCSYELKTTRKMFEKHEKRLPTCVCGTKMALDLEDEEEINLDN